MPDTPPAEQTFSILPHPNPSTQNQPTHPAPIPIHLPNIYVNPYPPVVPPAASNISQPLPPAPPAPPSPPRPSPLRDLPSPGTGAVRIGTLKMKKVHPLLYVSLVISIIALVLGVPKGSLPTLTGRHKELRAQERLLDQKIHLLNQLSTFLPPPLQPLVRMPNPSKPSPLDHLSLYHPLHPLSFKHRIKVDYGSTDEDLLRLTSGFRFWNTAWGKVEESDAGWWSIDDLGRGATVVKTHGGGEEKEVWVVRIGEAGSDTLPLQTALTHSLLLRDKLQREMSALRENPCPPCPTPPSAQSHAATLTPQQLYITGPMHDQEQEREIEKEWERRRSREREREREVEEREREVARREKWVVDEMRKITDKVHSQVTELTLEDRITERLKAYQRQLANLQSGPSEETK